MRPVLLSSPARQRSGPQSIWAWALGAGALTSSVPASASNWPPWVGAQRSAMALRLVMRHAPGPSAGSCRRACSGLMVACQDDAASGAEGVPRPPLTAPCRSSVRGPWVSCAASASCAWARRPSSVSASGCATTAGWLPALTLRRGALRRACTSGSRQPPRQRPSSVALPLACTPAKGGEAPGSWRNQARARAASARFTFSVPAPLAACSSPCAVALRPGACRRRSARPPSGCPSARCSCALPASWASAVFTRSCSSVSTGSAQRPRARALCSSRGRVSPVLAGAGAARACSAVSKSTAVPTPCARAVPSMGTAANWVCRRAGFTWLIWASMFQGAAVGSPAARRHRPLARTRPPPARASRVRTVAVPSCHVRSACTASTGNWRRSQGPAAGLARSALRAQPAAGAGKGASWNWPLNCVRGAWRHRACRSMACTRPWASGRGCAAQAVMRAVTWAWAAWAGSAPTTVCTSACACRSASGPRSVAATVSGRGGVPPSGTVGDRAPDSAASSVKGAWAPRLARPW